MVGPATLLNDGTQNPLNTQKAAENNCENHAVHSRFLRDSECLRILRSVVAFCASVLARFPIPDSRFPIPDSLFPTLAPK
jgi:hypothetical protein